MNLCNSYVVSCCGAMKLLLRRTLVRAGILFGIVLLCFVAYCVLKIIGHYDTRNNEVAYRRFAKLLSFLGLGLFILVLLLETFFFRNSTNP
jgi:hypothetical protein